MHTRSYHPEDLAALTTLVNHCARGGEATVAAKTRESLASEIDAPSVDRDADLRIWQCDDEIRAFARLDIDPVDGEHHGRLYYAIARADDAALEPEIWQWAAKRLCHVAGDAPARLVHAVDVQDPERGERLHAAGFVRFRSYLALVRPLDSLPSLAAPQGFAIRGCRPTTDAVAYVGVYNVAFADAYRFTPLAVDDFLHDTTSPSYDAELDLVLVDPEGQLAGYCFAEIDAEHPQLGHVASLGVLPSLRRRGLAEALLGEALRRLAQRGATRAHLFVDADSPTGATRLYGRIGFEQLYVQRRFELAHAGLRELAARGS